MIALSALCTNILHVTAMLYVTAVTAIQQLMYRLMYSFQLPPVVIDKQIIHGAERSLLDKERPRALICLDGH